MPLGKPPLSTYQRWHLPSQRNPEKIGGTISEWVLLPGTLAGKTLGMKMLCFVLFVVSQNIAAGAYILL